MEKTPSREQAIVFNSIDGVPQIEYILAIGKLVQPKKKKIVSRISNNRFCIFLSNKQIMDNLMQKNKSYYYLRSCYSITQTNQPCKTIYYIKRMYIHS